MAALDIAPDRPRTMGEACDELGVSARTLRYYEEVGLVLPGRTPGGHRVYGANEIETVGRIQRMQAMGLSLSTIRKSLRYRAYRDETGRRKFDVPTLAALAGEARTDAQALRARITDLERELTAARGEAEGLERDAAFLEGLLTERRAEEEARRGRRP
jgi:MerR family transcriptional regulator, repressor of the yfmOP operon